MAVSVGVAWQSVEVRAHAGAKGVVADRMHMMKEIQALLKTIVAMQKGEKPFDGAAMAKAAREIAGHGSHMLEFFPKNSLQEPTEARKEIWQNWSRFERMNSDMVRAGRALSAAAQKADKSADVADEFRALAATCGACHRDFRNKK